MIHGFGFTQISPVNPRKAKLKPITSKAMVDAGAMTLCIPEDVAVQLQLEENKKFHQNQVEERRTEMRDIRSQMKKKDDI